MWKNKWIMDCYDIFKWSWSGQTESSYAAYDNLCDSVGLKIRKNIVNSLRLKWTGNM